jgi:hypothetical protein
MTFFLQLPEMMPPKMSATAMNMKMNNPAFVNFAVLSGIVMLPMLGLASAPLSDAEADLINEPARRGQGASQTGSGRNMLHLS